jgi:hypothetical protein
MKATQETAEAERSEPGASSSLEIPKNIEEEVGAAGAAGRHVALEIWPPAPSGTMALLARTMPGRKLIVLASGADPPVG